MTQTSKFALTQFLDQHRAPFEAALSQSISATFTDSRSELQEAMSYSLLAPAKRFRPMLALASYSLFEDTLDPIFPLACALEMIHCYSLIHDDLPDMDNDDYRRGRLTCHKVYGNDMAILAGDTLNSFAFEILSRELPKHFPAERVLAVIQDFSQACGIEGLAGGQALDLRPSNTRTAPELENIHRRKTGALIRAAVSLPARLHSDDLSIYAALCSFGESLGLLFQIVDDILDVTGSSATLGKTANKDQEQGKHTFVSLYGLDQAIRMKNEEADKARQHLTPLKGYDSTVLNDLIHYIQWRDH